MELKVTIANVSKGGEGTAQVYVVRQVTKPNIITNERHLRREVRAEEKNIVPLERQVGLAFVGTIYGVRDITGVLIIFPDIPTLGVVSMHNLTVTLFLSFELNVVADAIPCVHQVQGTTTLTKIAVAVVALKGASMLEVGRQTIAQASLA